MLTDDLDAALTRVTTPAVDAELQRMSRAAEQLGRPSRLHRLGRRGVTIGVVALLLAGGGTAAAAASGVPFPWSPGWDTGTTITLESGLSCEIAISIGSVPDLAPDTTAAGRKILTRLDLDSTPIPGAESAADCTTAGREIAQIVTSRIRAELVSDGYDVSHLGFVIGASWNPKQ